MSLYHVNEVVWVYGPHRATLDAMWSARLFVEEYLVLNGELPRTVLSFGGDGIGEIAIDGWGNALSVEGTKNKWEIVSYGSDGCKSGVGDNKDISLSEHGLTQLNAIDLLLLEAGRNAIDIAVLGVFLATVIWCIGTLVCPPLRSGMAAALWGLAVTAMFGVPYAWLVETLSWRAS